MSVNGALRLASKAPTIRTSSSRANHESAVGALLAKRIHARGGQRSLSPCEQGSNDPDLPILSESRICRWSFACKANSRPWRVTGPFALRARLQRSGPPHPERITNPPLELCLQSEFTPGVGNGALRLASKAPTIRPPHSERITNPPLELCSQSEFPAGAGNGTLRLASKAPTVSRWGIVSD